MDSAMQDAATLLANEKRTLDYIRNKAATLPSLTDLHQSADDAFHRFNDSFGMNVYLKWPVAYERGKGAFLWLHIGGLIQTSDNVVTNASYYLCIAKDESSDEANRVIQKFHFDYASPPVRLSRRSAAFHLQSPGRLPPELKDDHDDSHMDTWLDEPRILCTPMSLALILHLAFREFPDENTNKICEDGAWQGFFVRRDESLLLIPFLEKCLEYVRDEKRILWDAACEVADEFLPAT